MKWIAKTSALTIRPYQVSDRDALMKIAADTAFFGAPIEKYMEDRRIFLDQFYAYYTDFEPEHAWVAVADEHVVGFLTGCSDTLRQRKIVKQKIMPKVIWRFITGKYHPGPKTWAYVKKLRHAESSHQFPTADPFIFPAHLHINVDQRWRGFGIGMRLIQSYLDQLIYENVPGVHLGTTSENEIACRLYTRMGFLLLDARPTNLWEKYIDHPVENRTYGLILSNENPNMKSS
jgi:ribosomal protein S18 acetylase RimI-like enzyme